MGYAAKETASAPKDTVSAPKETAATGFISIKRVSDAFRSAAKWFESHNAKSASDTATAPVAEVQKKLDTVINLLGTGTARSAVEAEKSENKRINETINQE